MLCDIRVEWPTDFVKQQACIAKEPKCALDELLFLHGKLEHVDAERTSLSRQSNKAERRLIKLERECDEQSSRARRSEHAQQEAESRFRDLEVLRKVLEKQVSKLEVERDNERVRADDLQRRISKLQSEVRQGQRGVRAALQKLARSPVVAKRIAAAFHPDKCPQELSEVASELFRFVQSNRERSVD